VLNCRDNFGRIERVLKEYGRAKQRRYPDSHELAEDMAERNQIEKPERVDEPFPFEIGLYGGLERLEIRKDISVRDDDALWLGRRPGGENDLRDGLTIQWRRRIAFRGVAQRRSLGAIERDCIEAWRFQNDLRAWLTRVGILARKRSEAWPRPVVRSGWQMLGVVPDPVELRPHRAGRAKTQPPIRPS